MDDYSASDVTKWAGKPLTTKRNDKHAEPADTDADMGATVDPSDGMEELAAPSPGEALRQGANYVMECLDSLKAADFVKSSKKLQRMVSEVLESAEELSDQLLEVADAYDEEHDGADDEEEAEDESEDDEDEDGEEDADESDDDEDEEDEEDEDAEPKKKAAGKKAPPFGKKKG